MADEDTGFFIVDRRINAPGTSGNGTTNTAELGFATRWSRSFSARDGAAIRKSRQRQFRA